MNKNVSNNKVVAKKQFNIGKAIGILMGVCFGIFMIGTIATMVLDAISFDVDFIPMKNFFVSLITIIKRVVPILTLIIGMLIILIIGYNNKKQQ